MKTTVTSPGEAPAPAATPGETAFDLLEREHEGIRAVFGRIRDPDADRGAALADAITRMATHVAVERSYIYPLVKRRQVGSPRLGRALLWDYKRMEKLLAMADRRKSNSPDMPELVTELMDVFQHHQSHCSAELMAALQEQLGQDELQRLGTEMRGAENVILSHPHPYLLRLGGPIYRQTTRVASGWDRLRDRTVRNR